MKTIQHIIYIVALASSIIACKGDDPKPLTEEEQTLKELAKTWSLTTANVDGENVAEWFSGLKVSFTENKSFTVQNAVPPLWIASGSFELVKSGSVYLIKRSDGVELTITALSNTNVTVTMDYTASSGARVEGISGSYTFEFAAQ